jgi:hypothetical protein
MAFQFTDGFDAYANASELYEFVTGTISYSSAYARFAPPAGLPGQGIKIASNGAYVRKNMQSNQQTFIIKLAVNFAGLGGSSTVGNPFFAVWDNGGIQWSLVVFPSGSIGIINSNINAIQIQTGPGVIATGLWYGIEIAVEINGTSSTAQVWLNGFQIFNATGLHCQATANAYGNQVSYGDINDNGLTNMMIDDVRVWDNTGSTQNAAIGTDSRLVTKLPSGAGAFTGFTPNGASANWQCVDDNPPDGDTTYVSSTTAGTDDAYTVPSAGFTAAPVMVVAQAYARKDDSAPRTLEVGVSSSGSTASGASAVMGSSYAFVQGCVPDDPHTSALWTAAGADAAQPWQEETV